MNRLVIKLQFNEYLSIIDLNCVLIYNLCVTSVSLVRGDWFSEYSPFYSFA